uniref:Uncharacterized protein n=1 Tax=Trypanosoma congolense (strain IL3000) TaxID=1068625 RepID=G0UVL4_TRYCI|nr:conserved hypothetical protein [Trypanosoma congolense IL3000]
MEMLTENLKEDLDLVRSALARASLHAPTVAAAVKPCNDVPLLPTAQGGSVEVLPTTHAGELKELKEKLAALSAVEIQKSKLEVLLAARDAAIKLATQSQHASLLKEEQQQSELEKTTCELREAKAELEMWRERHQRLQRESQLLQQELDALAGQCDRLQRAVLELQESSHQVVIENNALRKMQQKLREECDALQDVREEFNKSSEREKALQFEIKTLRNTNTESEAYLKAAVTEIEGRRQYWAAVQGEHELLVEALAEAQHTARAWEARFAAECTAELFAADKQAGAAPICAPGFHARSTVTGSPSEREQHVSSTKSVDTEASDDDLSLITTLETKVVELTLSLQEESAARHTTQECYDALVATIGSECCELVEIRRMLAERRPEWLNLTEANTQLQATLVARESYIEALQAFAITLLDDLTDLSLHCYELEVQLATGVVVGTSLGGGGGRVTSARRPTAHSLLQNRGQQKHEPWRITVAHGNGKNRGG